MKVTCVATKGEKGWLVEVDNDDHKESTLKWYTSITKAVKALLRVVSALRSVRSMKQGDKFTATISWED